MRARRAILLLAVATTVSAATPVDVTEGRGATAAETVVSFPGPGWRAASPTTTITIRGVPASALAGLQVVGSTSGEHAGAVHALRREVGAVFRPAVPFVPGERVAVSPAQDGPLRPFSFTVAVRVSIPAPAVSSASARGPAGGPAGCRLRRMRLHTRPRYRPARWCLDRRPAARAAPGEILVTPQAGRAKGADDQDALMMVSRGGRLLWYSVRPGRVRDLSVVTYAGKPALAFFEDEPGRRKSYVLLDSRYREIGRLRPGNGYTLDMHELRLTPYGGAYFIGRQIVRDPQTGTPVLDNVVQERDVATGDVLFEWHGIDHVPSSASYLPRPHGQAWDYLHLNSIEPPAGADGTIIVSARNTSAVYGIDQATGGLLWTLGGRRDQFGVTRRHPGWRFCAQHDARRIPGGDLSIFDNGGRGLSRRGGCPLHTARVEIWSLDTRRRTARIVRTIPSLRSSVDRRGYMPYAVGNAERERGGNMLVNWGTDGRVSEVTPSGAVVFAARFERFSYRAVAAHWVGRPATPPTAAARRRARGLDVWATWNGATEVRAWQVLEGRSARHLRRVGRPERSAGIETRLRVARPERYVAVAGLGASGSELGRSAPVRPRG